MNTRMTLTLALALSLTAAAGTPASATEPHPIIGAKLRAQALARQNAGAPAEDIVAALTRAALMDPGAADTWAALADAVDRLYPTARVPTPAERVAWRIAEAAGATPAAGIAAAAHVPLSTGTSATATANDHASPRFATATAGLAAGPARAGATMARTGDATSHASSLRAAVEQARARIAASWSNVSHARTWHVLGVAARNWERDFQSGLATLHPYRPGLALLAATLLALLAWARSRRGQVAPRERAAATANTRLQEARRLAHSGAERTEVARSTGLARDAIELLAPGMAQPDRSAVSGRSFRLELARQGVVGGRLNHVIA